MCLASLLLTYRTLHLVRVEELCLRYLLAAPKILGTFTDKIWHLTRCRSDWVGLASRLRIHGSSRFMPPSQQQDAPIGGCSMTRCSVTEEHGHTGRSREGTAGCMFAVAKRADYADRTVNYYI